MAEGADESNLNETQQASGKQSSPTKKKKKKRSRKTKMPKYPDAGIHLKSEWDYEPTVFE